MLFPEEIPKSLFIALSLLVAHLSTSSSHPHTDDHKAFRTTASEMPEIPKAELIMVFNSLQPAKPGYYEVPDWMIEYFKDQLQAR